MDKKLDKFLLEDMTFNSNYEILEYSKNKDELTKIAEKKGLQVPSKDLSIFKCTYAMVDEENRNGCTLPRKEVKKALGSLAGKAVDKDHLRKNTIGYWLDSELEGDTIIAYGVFWKSNFSEDYDEIKKRMNEGKVKISFEAWGERKFKENGSYDLVDVEFAGGAILLDTVPAFPDAEVLEFSTKKNHILEFAKLIEEDDIEESRIDITEQYIRIRQKEPSEFEEKSFRTIILSKSKGVHAIIGVIKGEKSTTIQSYLFEKTKFSTKEAKDWVKKHKGESATEEIDMEESKLNFYYDQNTIGRIMSECKCPQCDTEGYHDIDSIDFDEGEIVSTCNNCGGKNKMKMVPDMKIVKKGKKQEKASKTEANTQAIVNDRIIGGIGVNEILKKYNKATIEEFAKFIDDSLASISAKEAEIAVLTAAQVDLKKQISENQTVVENAKLEAEKAKTEFAVVKAELDTRLAAEKATFVKTRKDELGEEFAKDLTDEDITNDMKFENAKLKKEIAMIKKNGLTQASTIQTGLEAGAAGAAPIEESFKKQDSIRKKAFGQ